MKSKESSRIYADFIMSIIFEQSNSEKEINKLISQCLPWSKEQSRIRNEYNFDRALGFNIFSSISDIYYRENFHSDILRYILDPFTETIGNRLYIDLFIDILNEGSNRIIEYFNEDVKVMREPGRIDILIFDQKQALIIENKINNAIDQPNQLANYINYVKRMNINIAAIIYLTLTPGKRPDLVDYSEENRKFVKELIIYLPAINSLGNHDLTHNYFAKCITKTDNIVAKVYLEQYSNLLKHLGGEIMMKEFEKNILKEIYSNKESINTVLDIVKIWENRKSLLGEIIQETIKKADTDFLEHDDYGETIYKKCDDTVSVGFHKDLSFGFIYTPGKTKIPQKTVEALEVIMKDKIFEKYSTKIESDGQWVWRDISIDTREPIDEICKLVLERLNILSTMYKRLKGK